MTKPDATYTLKESEFTHITLSLERAACLAWSLYALGETWDIAEEPWFKNFLGSVSMLAALAEEVNEYAIERVLCPKELQAT